MSYDVLTINPGSTSTKLAVYHGDKVLFEETVRHTMQEFADLTMYRNNLILDGKFCDE